MKRKLAQSGSGSGGQCWDRTNDKLIKSHVLLFPYQPLNKANCVKPSLAGQYVALVLSNFACGLLLTSAWLDLVGGRHG